MKAVAMKVSTASKDDHCSEASPQMPWPEVQPLPSRAPYPTKNPPITSCHTGTAVFNGAPPAQPNHQMAAPKISPAA